MKKIIFRILGALSSALIITAVFVPFVSVTGYSQSLWQAHEATGTLYLPIMIIVFGAIGVIFFSINIKTELAYTSSGALLFFLITQTIPIIDQGTFKSLGVGYYFLAVGTIFTGIMAFLCNLKSKQKVVEAPKEEQKEISVINQLDKLYDNQPTVNDNEQNVLDNVIQPLQVQPNLSENINVSPVNPVVEPIEVQNNIPTDNQSAEVVQPVQNTVESETTMQELNNNQPNSQPVDVHQPTQNSSANPVVAEFNVPISNVTEASNPVVAEFSSQPSVQNAPVVEQPMQQNPVVAEFNNLAPTSQPVVVNQPVQSTEIEQPVIQPIETTDNTPKVDVMADPTNNSGNNLDIFG